MQATGIPPTTHLSHLRARVRELEQKVGNNNVSVLSQRLRALGQTVHANKMTLIYSNNKFKDIERKLKDLNKKIDAIVGNAKRDSDLEVSATATGTSGGQFSW